MATKKRFPPKRNEADNVVFLFNYEITDEVMSNNGMLELPVSVREELEQIHSLIVSGKFSKKNVNVISRLEELELLYPDAPVLSNYVVIACQLTKSPKEATCIEENYRKHPDYLFARLQYADQCLTQNKLEEIKDIFKQGFDLKLLYPERDKFHISEFIGFNTFLCRYYVTIGEQEKAEMILNILEKIAPEHQTVKQAIQIVKGDFLLDSIKRLTERKSTARNKMKKNRDLKS